MNNFFSFEDTSDGEIKVFKVGVDAVYLLNIFIGIPLAGFFFFVWKPLSEGLTFIVLFTFIWTIPSGFACKQELKQRESNGINDD